MTRPSDSAIRPGILAACTQAAMAGHLGGLSLKQLSQAVRISPRMLIYHFGSAEALVSETLIGVQQLMRAKLHSSLVQDQSRDTRKAMRDMLDHGTSQEMVPFFRSYYFFISESMGSPGRNAYFIKFSIDGMRNWIKTQSGRPGWLPTPAPLGSGRAQLTHHMLLTTYCALCCQLKYVARPVGIIDGIGFNSESSQHNLNR